MRVTEQSGWCEQKAKLSYVLTLITTYWRTKAKRKGKSDTKDDRCASEPRKKKNGARFWSHKRSKRWERKLALTLICFNRNGIPCTISYVFSFDQINTMTLDRRQVRWRKRKANNGHTWFNRRKKEINETMIIWIGDIENRSNPVTFSKMHYWYPWTHRLPKVKKNISHAKTVHRIEYTHPIRIDGFKIDRRIT